MIRALATLLVVIFCGQVFAEDCSFAEHDLNAPPKIGTNAVEVEIHLYLNDLVDIHDSQQSFESDVFVRAEWMDSRLAHGGMTACIAAPHQIWTPELKLLNRRHIDRADPPVLSVAPDGRVTKAVRAFGEFTFREDLSDFPFDHQELYYTLVSSYKVEDVRISARPEHLGSAEYFSVSNWDVQLDGARSGEYYVAPLDRSLSRLDIVFQAQRLTGFYTWQLLLPLFLVVMMTWTVFWIPREFVPPRVGLVATSMLTLIAYRFAMASILPPIAYLTRLDKFMVASSVLVFGALAATVAVTYLDGHGQTVHATRLNRASRWLAPLLFMLVSAKVFLL